MLERVGIAAFGMAIDHAAVPAMVSIPFIAARTGTKMAGDRRHRTNDPRQAAEAAFKAATTKPPAPLPKAAPSLPGVKELVSLRIDRDILDHFQEDGPGWQERINEALRKAIGK
jgi:uncharacterized protein (DUF4415 family)